MMFNNIKMQVGSQIRRSRRSLSKFLGATGTEVFAGFITNEDFTTAWDGIENIAATVRKMMDGDPIVQSTVLAIKTPILQSNARIEPASDDPVDIGIADFVDASLFVNPFFTWHDWLEDSLRHLQFGAEWMEKSYTFSPEGNELFNNKLVWNFQHRKPETIERFFPDEVGSVSHVEQEAVHIDGLSGSTKTVVIPREKLFHIANDQEGDNWYGRSIIRSAYRSYKMKDLLIRFDTIKGERYSVGTPRVIVTNKASEAEARKAAKDFRSNEQGYMIQTDGFTMDFPDIGGGKAGVDMIPSIKLHNQEIRSNILGDVLGLGKDEVGARALGDTFEDIFMLMVGSVITNIEDAMNRGKGMMQNIKQIVDLNFANVKKYPELKIDRPGADKVQELVSMAKDLVPLKILTADNELENKVRVFGGLKKLEDDAEIDRSQSGHEEEEKENKLQMQHETGKNVNPEWINTKLISAPQLKHRREETELESTIMQMDIIEEKIDKIDSEIEESNNRIREKITQQMVERGITIASKPKGTNTAKDIEELLSKFEMPFLRELGSEIVTISKEMFAFGRKTQIEELARQETKSQLQHDDVGIFGDTKQVEDAIRPLVNIEVLAFSDKMLDEWRSIVLEMFISGAITASVLKQRLNRISQNKFNLMAKQMANRGFGMGRTLEVLKARDRVNFMVRSELLDDNTCGPCIQIDGKTFKVGSVRFASLSAGPNPGCLGGSSCRGLNIAVVK